MTALRLSTMRQIEYNFWPKSGATSGGKRSPHLVGWWSLPLASERTLNPWYVTILDPSSTSPTVLIGVRPCRPLVGPRKPRRSNYPNRFSVLCRVSKKTLENSEPSTLSHKHIYLTVPEEWSNHFSPTGISLRTVLWNNTRKCSLLFHCTSVTSDAGLNDEQWPFYRSYFWTVSRKFNLHRISNFQQVKLWKSITLWLLVVRRHNPPHAMRAT